jgi:hypothetical protein
MEKKFDCLKMKEEIQAKVYEKTKDMTFPELRDYLDKSLENDTFWQRLVQRDNARKQRFYQHIVPDTKD